MGKMPDRRETISHSVAADDAWADGSAGGFDRGPSERVPRETESSGRGAPGWLATAAGLIAAAVALVFGHAELAVLAIVAGRAASLVRSRMENRSRHEVR
jgi:hypothetical protein